MGKQNHHQQKDHLCALRVRNSLKVDGGCPLKARSAVSQGRRLLCELPARVRPVTGVVDPSVALILVAVAYTIAGVVFVRNMDLSFDETVYLSQVNPRVLTLYLSAPRTRGVSIVA